MSALSFSDDFKKKQMTIIFSIVLFVASLILLSGMINFLKFAIQMFYNRQREVALRKSMGSDARASVFRGILHAYSVISAVTCYNGNCS